MTRLTTFVLASILLLTSFAAGTAPASCAETVLSGRISSERVKELTSDIHWYSNLKDAEKTAKAQGKLVFWVHMVGKIDGAT